MKVLRHLLTLQMLLFMGLLLLVWTSPTIAAVPSKFNYQGVVKDISGVPFDGNGYFKFAIVDSTGTTAYWANDGITLDGSEPTTAVTTTVINGKFAVKIGDPSHTNMAVLDQAVFNNSPVYMRVWFSYDGSTFELFNPDAQFLSNAFAVKAASADSVTNYDSSRVQTRVTESCIGDDTISAINEDGSVVCQTDDNTIYTAGTGISISGDAIGIAPGGVSDTEISDVAWDKISGIPADIADGDQGITKEDDPTVPPELKDGVSWSEVSGIPAGFADGSDDGITSESDPKVGALENGTLCSSDGTTVDCTAGDLTGTYIIDSNTLAVDATNNSVGIGTLTPGAELQVHNETNNSSIRVSSNSPNANKTLDFFEGSVRQAAIVTRGSGSSTLPNSLNIYNYTAGASISFGTASGEVVRISDNGSMEVNGAIVQRGVTLHADYVFEPNYKLESIEEHAAFMWNNKHLRAIPAARTDNNGLEVVEIGSHQKGIVEELEKAHIYIEKLNRENREMRRTNKELQDRLAKIEALLSDKLLGDKR